MKWLTGMTLSASLMVVPVVANAQSAPVVSGAGNPPFLNALELSAEKAAKVENDFRRASAERAKVLERERTFAYRRLNFMRAVAEAVASAENKEIAIAAATAAMRTKLGWSGDSEAPEIEYRRATVLSRLVPVARQVSASVAPTGDAPTPDVAAALTDFEAWYRETYPQPFWTLFEHYMPDTPRTDF
jgi:hypothetical protein